MTCGSSEVGRAQHDAGLVATGELPECRLHRERLERDVEHREGEAVQPLVVMQPAAARVLEVALAELGAAPGFELRHEHPVVVDQPQFGGALHDDVAGLDVAVGDVVRLQMPRKLAKRLAQLQQRVAARRGARR